MKKPNLFNLVCAVALPFVSATSIHAACINIDFTGVSSVGVSNYGGDANLPGPVTWR